MSDTKQSKIFVLDTNVLLHDHNCIYQFQDNDIVLPITILEELDKFKKGNNQINFQAREFVRKLDKLIGDDLPGEGISLGKDKGKLIISTGRTFPEEMKKSFMEDIPDHRILAVAAFYAKQNPTRKTILVSKDVNLRLKAKSIGVLAEDYKNDKIKNPEVFKKAATEVSGISDAEIDTLYKNGSIALAEVKVSRTPAANEYFVLQGSSSSILTRYDKNSKRFISVNKKNCYGIKPRNAEQTFSLNALMDKNINLVSLTGKAGTGKTLMALAAALEQSDLYDQILLARPIVALSDKDLGFLPGSAEDKINPYMQPLFDNISVIKRHYNERSNEFQKIDDMLKAGKLIITPLAYIRGRSLSNSFFIIDESQNLTPHEIKTIITRAGEDTKMVFTGDLEQIDSPYLDAKSNGLAYMTERMRNQETFAHVNMVKGERSFLSELASNLL